MKCRIKTCPNLLKGQFAKASIYDERRAKKDKLYKGPEIHPVCLECYKTLELNKYTLVFGLPAADTTKPVFKRVPRTDSEGMIEEIPLPVSERAPIENTIPEWARGVVAKERGAIDVSKAVKVPKVPKMRQKPKTALEALPPKFGRAD